MNCEHVKDELAVCFGQPEPPQGLLAHLESCQECLQFWNELRGMAGAMPANESFALEPWELDEAVAMVDRAIARQPLPMALRFRAAAQRWFRAVTDMRPLPAAAAVALVLVISLGTTRFELPAPDPDMSVELLSTSDGLFASIGDEIDDPGDDAVEALLSNFAQPWHSGTAEILIDDITDDEYEYLLQSLDVGDLL